MNTEMTNPLALSPQQIAQRKAQSDYDKGIERAIKRRKNSNASNTDAGIELIQEWVLDVEAEIKAYMEPYIGKGGNKPRWFKAFSEITHTRRLADLALRGVVDAAVKGWTRTTANEQVGRAFVAMLFETVVEGDNKRKREFHRFVKRMNKQHGDTYRRIDLFFARAKHLGWDVDDTDNKKKAARFSERNIRNYGSKLIDCVVKGVRLVDTVAIRKDGAEHASNYLQFSKVILDQLEAKNVKLDALSPQFTPMPVEPNPWSLDNEDLGPYNSKRNNLRLSLVKHWSKAQKQEVEDGMRNGSLDRAVDALNAIQAVPYQINEWVLEALEWSFEQEKAERDKCYAEWDNGNEDYVAQGLQIGGFPNIIEFPELPNRLPSEQWEAMDEHQRTDWLKDKDDIKNSNGAATSAALKLRRDIDEAKALVDLPDKQFWLPHNWDSRGRVYHIPEFGHHSLDYLRSLFMFANKQPIGKNIAFLDIHLVNCYGNKLDKKPLEERFDWIGDNQRRIKECGKDYKADLDFWTNADEPFQFLAACREYYLIHKDGKLNEDYMSGLPIGMDATNSAVQHYAASTLSVADGARVNLVRNDKPADLYEDCLAKAREIFEEDKERFMQQEADDPVTEEDHIFFSQMSKISRNEDLSDEERKDARDAWNDSDAKVRIRNKMKLEAINNVQAWDESKGKPKGYGRSVIKRQSMTFCYSSRKYGFSKQLRDDWLNELTKMVRLGRLEKHPFGSDRGYLASFYIADVHERAIKATLKSVEDGMKFFKDLAGIMAADGKHLAYKTPLNFPVHQNYRKYSTEKQEVTFYDRYIHNGAGGDVKNHSLYFRQYSDEIKPDKSQSAASPNIIHSYDSTHLMMTVEKCAAANIDLMLVHDSFSTTIGSAHLMSQNIKEAFVELYDGFCMYEDIMGQCKERHSDPDSVEWPEIPPKRVGGELDIKDIVNCLYCFL